MRKFHGILKDMSGNGTKLSAIGVASRPDKVELTITTSNRTSMTIEVDIEELIKFSLELR